MPGRLVGQRSCFADAGWLAGWQVDWLTELAGWAGEACQALARWIAGLLADELVG